MKEVRGLSSKKVEREEPRKGEPEIRTVGGSWTGTEVSEILKAMQNADGELVFGGNLEDPRQ